MVPEKTFKQHQATSSVIKNFLSFADEECHSDSLFIFRHLKIEEIKRFW